MQLPEGEMVNKFVSWARREVLYKQGQPLPWLEE